MNLHVLVIVAGRLVVRCIQSGGRKKRIQSHHVARRDDCGDYDNSRSCHRLSCRHILSSDHLQATSLIASWILGDCSTAQLKRQKSGKPYDRIINMNLYLYICIYFFYIIVKKRTRMFLFSLLSLSLSLYIYITTRTFHRTRKGTFFTKRYLSWF